jgi:hypothetical protein
MENALVVPGTSIAGLVAFVLIRLRAPSRARNSRARNLIDPGSVAAEFPPQEACSCGTIENKAS